MAINATLTVSTASDTAVSVRCTRKSTVVTATLQLALFVGLLGASFTLFRRGSFGFSALLFFVTLFWAFIYLHQVNHSA